MTTSNGATNGSNGHTGPRRPLPTGIYAPVMTFFDPETEDLDIPVIKKHTVRLAKAGLAGLVTMGSNGEAVHCTREEKVAVTQATREALDEAGFESTPIVFGATEGSMDEEAIYNYFIDLADASPIPIILYNYPGAVSGVDMDSDFLIKLAKHPNIIGTKFTCGSGYMAFGGIADFTIQTLVSGGSGIIAGGANVMPKTCVHVWDLYVKGKREEAEALQKKLSKGDWVLTKAAIAGTKSAIQSYFGYGGYPRRPLKRLSPEQTKAIEEGVREIMEIENSL
ncbi:hypothetical protein MRS44_012383 [Fusarium solani]|uniref:uncharacterized protein n=1 Tax=Fusarium solani TaxID=169388 RepID=UPI0032C4A529|nr:hypothetical protein MRS44_012383 [Fusarium solani]